jgi:sporulation protein YlmC with PRC-barrel domain
MMRSQLGTALAALAFTVSPGAVLAQTNASPPGAAQADLCRDLVTFLERRGDTKPASPVSVDQAKSFQRDNDIVACRDGVVRVQQAGITLPAALLAVVKVPNAAQRTAEGADVLVQPGSPTVTVQQQRPEITVRQPQPVVTVNIPQPEITVRMPQPDVNVARGRPQVQVVPSEQAQVQVQPAGQQPLIRYESAEPRVVVNRAQGAPQVRVEAMAQDPAGSSTAGRQVRQVSASALTAMDVMNGRGQQVGDVERLVRGEDKKIYAVVGHGGLFGLGEKQILLPVDRLMMHDGRLMIVGLTDEQIKAMPSYDAKAGRYSEVEASALAPLTVAAVPPAPGVDAAEITGTTGTPAARSFQVSTLLQKDIYNPQGQQLGDIERVLVGVDDKMYVVIGHGGFLGLGEKQILLPFDRIKVREDRLTVTGLTDDQIKAIPEFDRNARGYRDADRNRQADFPTYQG